MKYGCLRTLTAYCIVVCWKWVSANVNNLFTHEIATVACKNRSGLAPYHFKTIPLTVDGYEFPKLSYINYSVLDEGASAWVSGFVEMSGYLAWVGCFNTNDGIYIASREQNISCLYNCLQYCHQTFSNYSYIGLQKSLCFCLDGVRDLSGTKNGSSLDTCINLYRVLPIISSQHKYGQCLTVERRRNVQGKGRLAYFTTSCLKKYRVLCNGCKTKVCALTRVTKTWHGALKYCATNEGRLIVQLNLTDMRDLVINTKYWLGAFRSFTVRNTNNYRSSNTCLSVKRNVLDLYLEPRSCADKLAYICQADIIAQVSYPASNDSTYSSSNPLLLAFTLVSIIVFIGLCIFILMKIRNRHFKFRKRSRRVSNREHLRQNKPIM